MFHCLNEELIRYADSNIPYEVSGFICVNRAINAVEFIRLGTCDNNSRVFFSAEDYIHKIKGMTPVAIFHSHFIEDQKKEERFSKVDIENAELWGLPSIVYGVNSKKFYQYIPESFVPYSILGRPYSQSIFDCFTIIRDYYITKGIWSLKDFFFMNEVVGPKDFKTAWSIMENSEAAGFTPVDKELMVDNSVILIGSKNSRFFHFGVYNDGKVIHQGINKISTEEIITEKMYNSILKAWRYNDEV